MHVALKEFFPLIFQQKSLALSSNEHFTYKKNLLATIKSLIINFILFSAQNRKIFAEQDAERAMVFLLLTENDETRIAACQALAVMAESMLSRETIRNNGK